MQKEIINEALLYQRVLESRLITVFEEINEKARVAYAEKKFDIFIGTIFKHMYPENELIQLYEKSYYINESNGFIPEDELVVAEFYTSFPGEMKNIEVHISINALGSILFYIPGDTEPWTIHNFHELEIMLKDKASKIK